MTHRPVMLHTRSAISIGLALVLASVAGNFLVTSWRVGALEKEQEEHAKRLSALEATAAVHSTGLAVFTTELSSIKETLARIDGRLSGVSTARGRSP